MRDLSRHVVPSVAVKWYELGLELLETKHEKYLDVIESDGNKYDVQWCCRKMFRKWLETSDTATWDQLIEAIKSINLNDVASGIPSLLLQGEYVYWSVHDFHVPCNYILEIYIIKSCLPV